jgi:cyclopropane-fatty-acyl-phospholipid synthase
MNTFAELNNEFVTKQTNPYPSLGFAEKMLIKVLENLTLGGLRLEYSDGRVRYFGQLGAKITASIRLKNDREFFKRCAYYGNIGLGEAYADGLWDTDKIDDVISWFILNVNAVQGTTSSSTSIAGIYILKMVNWFRHKRRENSVVNSRRNIAEHYDLGNNFYKLWLDPSMTYSSAYFGGYDQSLQDAQTSKYDVLCRKLQLSAGDQVLEIGCGWGGFAIHAAQNYQCQVVGLTLSNAQAEYARTRVAELGLNEQIEIRIEDYRHVTGRFDKIASIEMLEAVGDKYHESFFSKCHEVLVPEGLLGVQMITVPDCSYASLKKNVDWIQKHIFPGSLLLSVGRVNEVLSKVSDLYLHDLEDLGADYTRTLSSWYRRFNLVRDSVVALGYDEAFIRSWNYYLKYCEAAFKTRNISVVQAIYTRPNNGSLHHNFSNGTKA